MKDAQPETGRAPPRTSNARFRGGGPTKLLGTLRGAGVVLGGPAEVAATYSLDVYESRAQRHGNGTLDGDFRALVPVETDDPEAAAPEAAYTLRLSDGGELPVTLTNVEDDGAEFETTGAIPGY